jgi:hypothetical protein
VSAHDGGFDCSGICVYGIDSIGHDSTLEAR